jgi:hypothetical protein
MAIHFRTRRGVASRGAIAALTALAAGFVALVSPSAPVQAAGPGAAAATGAAPSGYWMVGSDGRVYPFGDATDLGNPALPAGARATHIEPAPDGGGYYVLDDRGDVFAFGHAASLGNAALAPGETAVSLSATPSGQGYWIFTSAGRVITKGDARNLGDMSGKHLNAPVVSSTVTPDGSGYWMVAGDGGVFSFGAPFWGSTGNLKLNKPVEGIVPTQTDKGYWLVASDGGVFAFGDAGFRGSMGATKLNKPVVGLVRYGNGYLMVASDGGIFDFSDLPFQGSLGAHPPANPIVGTAALPGAAPGAPANGGGPTPPANGGGTTPTTAPANMPPGTYPPNVSSSAQRSWGTATDTVTPCYDTKVNPPLCFAQMVDSVVEIGDKVYVAGEFTNMVDPSNGLAPASPALPYLAVLDKGTWTPDASSPFNTAALQPDGPVMSLAASPDGKTLYVGGQFKKIGGGSSLRVAALDTTTGHLEPNWTSPQPDAAVNSVVLSNDGQHLYLGGSFSALGATPATYLAELDAATGAPIPAFGSLTDYGGYFSGHGGARVEPPSAIHASVHDLELSRDGSTLLVGGDFLHLGVQSDPTKNHAGLLAVDATTGQMTPWQPINTRPVFQITKGVNDATSFYVAAGGAGGNVQAFQLGGPTAPLWKVEVDGDGTGVAATDTEVFLVGHFGHVAASAQDVCPTPTSPTQPVSCNFTHGIVSNHLVAFDLTGKMLGNFTAQANTPKGPEFAYLGAQDLYVGGDFTGVASAPNPNGGVASYHKQPGLAIYHACPSTAAC